MSMGVFMPPPAPLMGGGGGGTVLDGTITVGDYVGFYFGWSDGSAIPPFGSISGDAASYLSPVFFWYPAGSTGEAFLLAGGSGFTLSFQGQDYSSEYDEGSDLWFFTFGPEVAAWPTSGTHPFTLTLP